MTVYIYYTAQQGKSMKAWLLLLFTLYFYSYTAIIIHFQLLSLLNCWFFPPVFFRSTCLLNKFNQYK